MQPFDEWVRERGDELDRVDAGAALEVGAALIARDAHPDLDVRALLARLDALAVPLLSRGLVRLPVEDAARQLSRHLYEVEKFRGNEADYGDPRNSYLDDVLERRLGIPISLAVVYLAVARRVGVVARGVSFPGHFLVRCERPEGEPLVIDPFHHGRVLGIDDLRRLLEKAGASTVRAAHRPLEPATARAILVRMLTNLKNTHAARGDAARALLAATRIVTLMPREPWAVRDRGLLQARCGASAGARADLVKYLELAPAATDAERVRAVLSGLTPRAAN